MGSPEIERPSSGERGADLGHGDADEPSEEGDDDPTPDEARGPPVEQARSVKRRDSREQRHRRERNGQGLEQSHFSSELLLVAELVEALLTRVHLNHGDGDTNKIGAFKS